jgi:hypothetical protein
MQNVHETVRHASPGPRPQPLAFVGSTLWAGAWDTDRLYAIDPRKWQVLDEVEAPGRPYGMAAHGDALRVVISHGEDDDRHLYSFVPGRGFDAESKTACPDLTGSHLASNGEDLFLCQMTFRRILKLNADGTVARGVALPSPIVGVAFRGESLHGIAADDEFENLQFVALDIASSDALARPLGSIPFDARALAYDGRAWWTSHREASEIVSFEA